MQQIAGAEDLQLAQTQLDAAGVPYASTVMVGCSARTIAAAATAYGCDRIVFGDEQPGLAGRVFGSSAGQVRHMRGSRTELQVIGSRGVWLDAR